MSYLKLLPFPSQKNILLHFLLESLWFLLLYLGLWSISNGIWGLTCGLRLVFSAFKKLVVPVAFVENTLFLTDLLWPFVENQLAVWVWSASGLSVPFHRAVCLSVCHPVVTYCSFSVSLKSNSACPLALFDFSRIVLVYIALCIFFYILE